MGPLDDCKRVSFSLYFSTGKAIYDMNHEFYAMISRMKYIDRWALMRNTEAENLMQHSYEVAVLAHALCVLGNTRCGMDLDADKAAVAALYHDASEILTGDMPTPVKYHSDELRGAYHRLEELSADRLLALLPEGMRSAFLPYLRPSAGYDRDIVKAADRISAYIKCLEERRAGNREFDYAAENIHKSLEAVPWPEVRDFLLEFLPAFEMTLDELNHPGS